MKQIVAVIAALIVLAVLAVAFEHSAMQAQPTPHGEVVVTELSVEPMPALAQASLEQ